jgi:hypothetical protein
MLSAKLMRDQITNLKKANKAANKQRQRKRKRIQRDRVLTKAAREDILAQQEAKQQIACERCQDSEQSGLSR